MNMRNLLLFALKVHIPVFLLLHLLLQGTNTPEEPYRTLAINLVYIHTALTYAVLFVLPSIRNIQPGRTGGNRIGVIGIKFFVIISWVFYYQFFAEYIHGTDWLILGYVAFITWITWASSFLQLSNWLGKRGPVSGLIYELTLTGTALLAAYSLYNCAHITEAYWVWLGGIFVNMSLLWFETIKYAFQIQIVSERNSLFFYLYGFPLLLFTMLLTYTAVCLVGR